MNGCRKFSYCTEKEMGFQLYSIVCLFTLIWNNNIVQGSNDQCDYVPDVLPYCPKSILSVKFGNVELNAGSELTPTQVKDQPTVTWPASHEEYYTVCMTDPDAPSREEPKFREFLHWLVGNVPGNDISKGETLAQYVGSGPPKGTGRHRYVLLVFKQPSKLEFSEPRINNTSRIGRPSFSIQQFANKYNLLLAEAGNYYLAQWDEYVPTVHKQLSGK